MKDYKPKTEGKQSPAETARRYLAQLNQLLDTARRMNNRRVIVALSGLIAKRGGVR